MADYLPKHLPGQAISLAASAKVIGGRLVAVTGAGTVGPAGADSGAVVGVAGFDAITGEKVTVYRGGVQRLPAAAAIAAGTRVCAAADGKVTGTGTKQIGLALTAAAKADDVVEIALD